MKFSGDYVNFKRNIIILITVALWEIHYRTYNFSKSLKQKGNLSCHGNRKRIFGTNQVLF